MLGTIKAARKVAELRDGDTMNVGRLPANRSSGCCVGAVGRAFQNCRSSPETELAKHYPLHVVCAWIGNTAAVAIKHYLQVRDADFDRAAGRDADSDAQATQNPTQQPSGDSGKSGQETTQAHATHGLVSECAMGYQDNPNGVAPLAQHV